MCYGSVVPDYAQGSLDAVDNTMVQLKDYYKRFTNTTLTDEQAYARLGTTPSIGFESEAHPYFTTAMLNKVIQHAKKKENRYGFLLVNEPRCNGGWWAR